MDVTPVGAIGSGRHARRAQVAGDNDYDRAVRIARRFLDEQDERRRRREAPPRKTAPQAVDVPADEHADHASDGDEPHAGAQLDTYL